MITFFVFWAAFYAALNYAEIKVPQVKLGFKTKVATTGVAALAWPFTLVVGALIGGGVYYHRNVKALPFVKDVTKIDVQK